MADLGHGATVTWENGFVANITAMSWSGITRAAVDSTTFSTSGGKTKLPADTYDPGTLTATIQHDPAGNLPITQAAESLTLTFPGNETMVASGFLSGYSITLADEEVTTAEVEITFSGNITGNLTVT